MRHPVWWYRTACVVLVLGVGYLVLSGRLAASMRFMSGGRAPSSEAEFFHHFLTNVMWIASIAPFLVTTHWVVTRRKAERTLGSYWDAAKTVFTVAWRRNAMEPDDAVASVEPPSEDSAMALVKGAGIALMVPTFFWFGPAHVAHTARTALWLGATGVWMGSGFYCMERARPFVKPSWLERQRGRFFGRAYTLSPGNYDPPGGRWIWRYYVFAALTAVTWLGGAALVMGR